MKKVSEKMGRIIVILAAIALLISCVVCFRGDIGNFFNSMLLKVHAIGNNVLVSLNVIDLEMDMSGPRVVLDHELSNDNLHPTAIDGSSLLVSGKVTDGSGVASLTVNGNSVDVNADGSWRTTVSVSSGVLKEIKVIAADNSGNITTNVFYAANCAAFTVDASNRHKVGYSGEEEEILEIPGVFYDEEKGKWCKVVQIGYASDADGSGAFQDCTNLKKVIMPDSVLNIGRYAFTGCTGLEEVSFSDKLDSIKLGAFSGCTSLTTLDIPDSVSVIDTNAFEGCTGLTSVELSSGLVNIGSSIFKSCTSLKRVVVPEGITSLGSSAFWDCSSLESITFDGNSQLSKIDNYAFQNCVKLKSIVIPKGVTFIGSQAFFGCTSLAEVTFAENCQVTAIGGNAFRNCSLTSFVIPEKVTSIGHYAFGGCGYLSKVIIGSKVTSIGHNAFNSCAALNEIIFKGSVSDWNNSVTKDVNWNYNVPAASVYCEADGQSVAIS